MRLFRSTPVVADRDDLSDSSEPKTQLQNVQRAELHITPIVTPTPTPPPVNPAPLSQAAGPSEDRGAASVAAPGVPQSSLVQHTARVSTFLGFGGPRSARQSGCFIGLPMSSSQVAVAGSGTQHTSLPQLKRGNLEKSGEMEVLVYTLEKCRGPKI